MNMVTLLGNLGADPELRQTEKSALLKIRLATAERVKVGDKWEDRTEWHQVTVWGSRAEGLAKILAKGDRILVVGKLKTRSYEDKEGVKRYSTEIHADEIELAGKPNSGGSRDDSRRDDRRPARNERPARRGRDEDYRNGQQLDREEASDPFAGYR